MLKYLPLIISFSIPSEKPCFFQKNKYAQHIKYSTPIIQKNNKNILEYNTTTTQEIIIQQNEKIMYDILIKEIK